MTDIVNWKQVFNESENFKNCTPTKWAFIEGFLDGKFYEELFKTYPKFDESWSMEDSYDKISYRKFWKRDKNGNIITENNEEYSKAWNDFMSYMWSNEFINKLVEFSGVGITNLRSFCFMYMGKNGFQLPHIHDVSDKTLIVFLYLTKNWKEGDPGGTYLSKGTDESKILFEPYNLDNSALIVLDGPEAAHGVRKIIKDVGRKAIQLTYEPYSSVDGWYSSPRVDIIEPLDL
jgi:hypothetical protein